MTEATEPTRNETAGKEKKWWCNFCNYKTDDEQDYLKHSCKDELEKQKSEKGS